MRDVSGKKLWRRNFFHESSRQDFGTLAHADE